MKTLRPLFAVMLTTLLTSPVLAHDTWVEPNTNRVRVGDMVHINLMLGNHGNHHRDFKLAGKVDPQHISLELIAPDEQRTDLKPRLHDLGTESNLAYWTAQVQPKKPGLHRVVCLDDKVVHYAPVRSIKSAKTFFLASERLDTAPAAEAPSDEPVGHPLELVLKTDPSALVPGEPIEVQLLYEGQPLADTQVSFIPRGVALQGAFDERYDRQTDAEGRALFEPIEATYHLVVAHHNAPQKSGANYESTKYAATTILYVSAIRPGSSNQ